MTAEPQAPYAVRDGDIPTQTNVRKQYKFDMYGHPCVSNCGCATTCISAASMHGQFALRAVCTSFDVPAQFHLRRESKKMRYVRASLSQLKLHVERFRFQLHLLEFRPAALRFQELQVRSEARVHGPGLRLDVRTKIPDTPMHAFMHPSVFIHPLARCGSKCRRPVDAACHWCAHATHERASERELSPTTPFMDECGLCM